MPKAVESCRYLPALVSADFGKILIAFGIYQYPNLLQLKGICPLSAP